jgi:hypothetical protein
MPENAADSGRVARRNGSGKVRLLTRDALDGRTRARKIFDAIAQCIAAERHLVEAFAGVAVRRARLRLGGAASVSCICDLVVDQQLALDQVVNGQALLHHARAQLVDGLVLALVARRLVPHRNRR